MGWPMRNRVSLFAILNVRGGGGGFGDDEGIDKTAMERGDQLALDGQDCGGEVGSVGRFSTARQAPESQA